MDRRPKSTAPSTKTGKIVDGKPKFAEPSTKTGKIVDGRRKFKEAVHENGENRGWETRADEERREI